ncbi:hypothetical protein TELCIR_14378 [Teladorsagia circumcincta]|uniref:Diphthine--ammonia ligase n=1 Tax=Teladorsagia circumcincta TaxID=45464 RepID=A0A2G9U142_TELCI|nr:hypothetical protein TELCIR_14378 [Teladorsagia circumcincta]
MDVVGLISGGKDSCYNMMCATEDGNRIVALANLHPGDRGELDSYMYQCVGSEGVATTTGDEVEDLYELLKTVKECHPSVRGNVFKSFS